MSSFCSKNVSLHLLWLFMSALILRCMKYVTFHEKKILLARVELIHSDRQTDRHDRYHRRFPQILLLNLCHKNVSSVSDFCLSRFFYCTALSKYD
jgi:hypothetical protein